MERISEITLDTTLPEVFAPGGDLAAAPAHVGASEVWMHRVTFRRPERYLIMAESGTGKSSMCSFIYGNRSDYRGTITFDGRDIRTFSKKDWAELRCRHLALLPQELRLFAPLTAMQNIMVKNRLTDRYSEAEIRRMLAELEVDHRADSPCARLSVGQQQRVALVRALAQPFDFLLLDEPVSHLDQRNNAVAAELVRRVCDQLDAAVVTTSVGNNLMLDKALSINL